MFIEDLYAMIERVCNDNVFVHAETETMRRIELAEPSAWLTNLASTTPVHITLTVLPGVRQI